MLATLGPCLLVLLLGQAQDPPAAAPARQDPAEGSRELGQLFPLEAPAGALACSLDGKLLAWSRRDPASDSADVVLVDAKTGRPIAELVLGGEVADRSATRSSSGIRQRALVTALAFTADGRVLAVGDRSGRVELFDTRSARRLRSLRAPESGPSGSAAEPSGSAAEPFGSGRAIGSVRSLAFTLGGSHVAVCGESFADHQRTLDGVPELSARIEDGSRLQLWEVEHETLARNLGPIREAMQVVSSPDGRTLALVGSWAAEQKLETGLVLWNTETGEASKRLSLGANGRDAAVEFSPDGEFLLVRLDLPESDGAGPKQQLTGIDFATCTVLWQRALEEGARPLTVHEEGFMNFGIVLSKEGSLVFYDGHSGQTLLSLRSQTATGGGRVTCMAAAKRGCFFVLGGESADGKGSLEVLDLSGER